MTTTSNNNNNNKTMIRVVLASFFGSFMEWYDFYIYGTAAALVFNVIFFPEFDPVTGTILSFGTFAVGFISRPLGGIIIGHFGDKIGRKPMLVLTMMIMGGGTFLIGVLPTYETIGMWAPVLLIILRFVQGIGLGGEFGGAALMTIEHSPVNKRNFWGSIIQAGSPVALIFSAGIFSFLSAIIPSEQFLIWGWRIPFLISILLVIVGSYVRYKVSEPTEFKKVQKNNQVVEMPVVEMFRSHKKSILLGIGASLGQTVSFNIINTVAIAYLSIKFGFDNSIVLTGIMIGAAISLIFYPLFGIIADKFGSRLVYMGGALITVLIAFPFFGMLNTGVPAIIWFSIAVAYIFSGSMMWSIQSIFLMNQFDANVRYSGLSITFQLTSIVGGIIPMLATSLIALNNNDPWLVALFLLIIGVIAFISAFFAKGRIANVPVVNQQIEIEK